ncbi:MAG TPA: pitrilysin family protein [Candidatus Edwardsbacteria bacterium]|nr:pitrilysin family protein [Candidatus Edwardsbacteria bacterium]
MPIRYHRTKLANGMTVISERIPNTHSVAVGFWLARGSRDETPATNGIAHLIEHMSFKGTATRSARDIALSLESIGGHLDAFTTKEETCFYARALDEHLPRAVDVIADLICHPKFSPQDLERERTVILEEIKGLEDTPDELIHDYFDQLVFDGHPLSLPIVGSAGNCRAFTAGDVMAHRRRMFVPANTVVAVAGNVDHRRLLDLLDRSCPDLPPGRPSTAKPRPPRYAGGLRIVRRDIAQVHLCLGFPALSYKHPARYALMLVSTILGGGMSSRLFQEIREDHGLAYSVSTFLELYRDAGLFGVYLGASPQRIQQAADMALAEFRKFVTAPVPRQEFDNAKAQLKGNMILGMESITNRMMRLAKSELIGEPMHDLDYAVRQIDAVKLEDMVRVAEQLFRPERLAATLLGPVKPRAFDLRKDLLS